MAEQLWPGLLAEAWAALAAAGDGAAESPDGPLPPGVDPRLPAGLEVLWVSGAPGHLPSRLPVEDTAIACTGAALLAAAALHAQRGGDCGSRGSPTARLDMGHVAAAFRSEAYLRVNGEQTGPGFAPLSRFWRAADGWVRTHGNYPWHRAALLRALACSDDPESVAAAIAALGARQAEDLVVGAGGVAAAVRGEDGWRAEPPGQAVAATRLVEGMSIGGAPPRWRPAGALPASGIRVLDLTRVIAGPVATRYLAALGADVLRLDAPDRPELTLHAYDGLPGKRSALLDFGTAGGNARLHELLSGADVLVHGYRPHALDRFGLSPELVAERHPGLVVVSLSAWGSRGPWGGRRASTASSRRPAVSRWPNPRTASGRARCRASSSTTAPGTCARPPRCRRWPGSPSTAAPSSASCAWPGPRTGCSACPGARRRPPPWPMVTTRRGSSTLDSAEGPVTTVRPPGRLDDEALAWPRSLSRYGGDQPAWGLRQSVHQFLMSDARAPCGVGFSGSPALERGVNAVGPARLGPYGKYCCESLRGH